jgi:hypothetical protein
MLLIQAMTELAAATHQQTIVVNLVQIKNKLTEPLVQFD